MALLRLVALLAVPWLSFSESLDGLSLDTRGLAIEKELIQLDQKAEKAEKTAETEKAEKAEKTEETEKAEKAEETEETETTKEQDDEVDKVVKEVEKVGKAHDFKSGIYFGKHVPLKVIGACSILTLITYGWFACGFAGFFDKKDGYSAFQAEKFTVAWYYWTAAFLLWIAMPLIMLIMAKDATCEGGPPTAGYVLYGFFLTAHIALMIIAVNKSPLKVAFCDCSKDFFLWGPILVFFLILDHMDMATDALFVGSAAACTDRISWQYQSSWEAVPLVGGELAFTIRELNFSGLVLFCFISFVYIPQITGIAPFFALVTTALLAVGMYLTLHWGSLAGLIVLVVALGIYALLGWFSKQWAVWKQWCVNDEVSVALYCGFGVFEQALTEGQANERLIFVTMTRLVFENLLQLWLQTSFFSLTFDFTDSGARAKNVLSMIISLLVAASKIPGLFKELRHGAGWAKLTSGFNCGAFMAWALILVVVFYAIVLVWIGVRLIMTYWCESHMWGLTTGCVAP